VSPDSRLVAGGSADQSVRIFDIETKQRVHVLENAHEDWVWAVGFTPNNKYVVSGAGDGSLKLFGLKTGLKTEELQNVNQGFERKILLWKINHFKVIHVLLWL